MRNISKNEITNIRFNIIEKNFLIDSIKGRPSTYGFGPGKIIFEYKHRPYSFGLGLDDTEANSLIQYLNERVG